MLNILTIDVEDYFQVHAFSKNIRYEDWGNYECRVERNTYRLLEILNSSIRNPNSTLGTHQPNSAPCPAPVTATFFVLGWIAERFPGLIREIKGQGHEIASHGYNHQIISAMSPDQFREDVHRSRSILEDLTGDAVIGYRAPNYSMGHQQLWALETLAEEGYRYDSSIYPIHHDTYGMPDAPRFPFTISFNGNGKIDFRPSGSDPYALRPTPCARFIVEFPLSTVRMFNVNIPVAGGGYFRLFPYRIVRRGLRRINREENRPFIFYLHPWEIDFEQPKMRDLTPKSRFRHYCNIKGTEKKFKTLLSDFQFTSIRGIMESGLKAPSVP